MSKSWKLERGTPRYTKLILSLCTSYTLTLCGGSLLLYSAVEQGPEGNPLWLVSGLVVQLWAGVLMSVLLILIRGITITYYPRTEPEPEPDGQDEDPAEKELA